MALPVICISKGDGDGEPKSCSLTTLDGETRAGRKEIEKKSFFAVHRIFIGRRSLRHAKRRGRIERTEGEG